MSESFDEQRRRAALFARCRIAPEHEPTMSIVAAGDLPQPYRRLLAHANHMTYVLQAFHADRMEVEVLSSRREPTRYCRTILLRRARDRAPLQWALMSIELDRCDPLTRERVLGEEAPLGRILIEHGYRTEVVLRSLLHIGVNDLLRTAFRIDVTPSTHTYGRYAAILLGDEPAIEVLEVMAPGQHESSPARDR